MDQISAQAGDVIGVHYVTLTNIPGTGVIPYADSRYPLCCGLSLNKLYEFYSDQFHYDGNLVIGDSYTFDASFYADIGLIRAPALSPVIQQ